MDVYKAPSRTVCLSTHCSKSIFNMAVLRTVLNSVCSASPGVACVLKEPVRPGLRTSVAKEHRHDKGTAHVKRETTSHWCARSFSHLSRFSFASHDALFTSAYASSSSAVTFLKVDRFAPGSTARRHSRKESKYAITVEMFNDYWAPQRLCPL